MIELGTLVWGTVVRIRPYGALVRAEEPSLQEPSLQEPSLQEPSDSVAADESEPDAASQGLDQVADERAGELVGLVHISEIADSFVDDVRDHLCEGARVRVKVLRRKDDGRYEFSIKRVPRDQRGIEVPEMPARSDSWPAEFDCDQAPLPIARPSALARQALEAKLRDFMLDSGERLDDLRRHEATKLGVRRR